ncbi:MAG: PilZ domain-containing protein [Phycisphaeraceae bacterium]|nr:PilZ domain-containing protein [Phycisphaeraceae bacterium]
MRPPTNPVTFIADAPKKQDNRIRGRLRVELLKCKLGDVQDLSSTGMRVRRRGRLMVKKGEVHEVTLTSLVGKQTVQARVMWIKRVGFFKHDLGLKFEGLTPEIEKGITAIARISVDARFIYGDHRVGDLNT